jgi:hypothetical protein
VSAKTGQFTVIEYMMQRGGKFKTSTATVKHGQSVLGRNIVAVIDGDWPHRKDCDWCLELRTRCISRRHA